MTIPITTDASLDIVTLQQTINRTESRGFVRLTSLIGKQENGDTFNAHDYDTVDDNTLLFSKLFPIPAGGDADHDPNVQSWLKFNPAQKVKCEEMVYISGSLTKIAVVR